MSNLDRDRVASRDFPIGDILTITTGICLTPRGETAVRDILNFMTGESLHYVELPNAADRCIPHLLRQHPQLAEIDASRVNRRNWQRWLGRQAVKYGSELPIEALRPEERGTRDLIGDLMQMNHNARIVGIDPEDLRS